MGKKKTITITALTEKGKEAIQTKGDTKPMEKACIKMFGIREEVTETDPYTVVTTFKRVPELVFEQIITGLYTKFLELDANKDKDYTMVVVG